MFCRYCGKKISDDSIKCSECGRNLIGKNKKVVAKHKINRKIILTIIIVFLILVGFGVDYIHTQKSISTIPNSKFVNKDNMIFKGYNKNIFAWATVEHHTDGELNTTLNDIPPKNLIGYRILIENKSNNKLNINASNFTLLLNDGTVLKTFEGENDATGNLWLNPNVFELNGTDISLKQLKNITLSKGEYCTSNVYFIINNETEEKKAIDISKEIKFDTTTSNGNIEIELKKINK